MAAPIIALGASANAQSIIYHDVVPDYEFTTSPGTSYALHIDIDADGALDVNLQIASQVGGFNFAGARPHSANGNKIMGFLNSSSYYASALNSGEAVDSNGNFWSQVGEYGEMVLYFLPNGSSGIYGEWQNNVMDKYLGFQILGGDGIMHYGWMRMDVFQNPVKMVIKDWAYQVDSVTGINAGDKCNEFFPTITALGATTFCDGYSVILETDSLGGDGYQWLKDGQIITGATDNKYAAFSDGSYTIAVTDSGGCAGESTSIAVNVNPLPQPVITQGSDTLYSNINAVSYQWYLNGNAINGATDQNYIASQSGLYSVMVTDGNGCTGTSNIFQFYALLTSSADVDGINIFSSGKKIHIQFNDEKYLGAEIKIRNSAGQTLVLTSADSKTLIIDLAAFTAGIFIVTIHNESIIAAGKIMID